MGLDYIELQELLKYIENNHSWNKGFDSINRDKKLIKYVSFQLDTRTCDIWNIKFRNVTKSKETEKEFRTEKGYNLKDEIYKWLKSKE